MKKSTFAAIACAATATFAANTANPTFLWDGSTDTEGRVITGSPEETSGYWYIYDDANDYGTSHFIFPPEFDLNTYDSYPFALMTEEYGGIKLSVVLDEGYEYPYVGLGFNIWNEEQEAADITAWEGICLEYSSELDFSVIVGIENEKTVIGYSGEEVAKRVSKSSSLTVVDLLWEKFNNPFALPIGKSENPAFAQAVAIKLKFQGEAGTKAKGEFFLKKIGSLGQCSGGTDAIKPVVNSQVNVSVLGRMVNFGGVVPSAKVSVMDLQGHIVKSATAASAMDLSSLPAGIYMLRVQGHGVNHMQKIILK
ncbi:MAG: T9SS type A sorting domain-containing protein [Fibrobacter sp.]|uniref:T9SS type A sorting domain-containing protein n=1 Tax=Fibrobacter sp. TaxID=35828 RepID=UPI0025BB98E7|nr:T9SS type A sorting domain-containing protein [Fibrobacter sp.]MBR4785980.1 T9SS type A sorting domain-containing protein [Fibrobacter sp.]